MTQPGRNSGKRLKRAISVLLNYRVKIENLWLRKFCKNRPRKLKAQGVANAFVDPSNKLCSIHISSSSTRKFKPASLTKVMVVMTALDEIENVDEIISVAPEDVLGGSDNNLKAGDQISWRDAFHNMLMASSNISANAVIRSLGLRLPRPEPCTRTNSDKESPTSRAIAAINTKAQSLGMTGTRFTNASGLDSFGMYTTARDMLLMGVAALAYPVLKEAWGKKVHVMKVGGPSPRDVEITSTLQQLFVAVPEVGGGKTGTLPDGTQNILIYRKRGDSRMITALMQKGGDRHKEILRIIAGQIK